MNDEYKEVPTRAEFEVMLKELDRQSNFMATMAHILQDERIRREVEKEDRDSFQAHYAFMTTAANMSFALQDSMITILAAMLKMPEIDFKIELLEMACSSTEDSIKNIPENVEGLQKDFRTSMEFTLYGLKKKLDAMKKHRELMKDESPGSNLQ